jgi:hypothetical protein
MSFQYHHRNHDAFTLALFGVFDAIHGAMALQDFTDRMNKRLAVLDKMSNGGGFVVFYADSMVQPHTLRCKYTREHDARRAAIKYTAKRGYAFAYTTMAQYVRKCGPVIAFNLLTGRPFLEAKGTPSYLSPSSETYHSM